jgi:hypothetical protein
MIRRRDADPANKTVLRARPMTALHACRRRFAPRWIYSYKLPQGLSPERAAFTTSSPEVLTGNHQEDVPLASSLALVAL